MNKTQREFRRKMKELEKEGLVDKQPRRTRSMRRTSGLGILGTLFIAWNLWAMCTWFFPGLAFRISYGIQSVIHFVISIFQ